MTDELMTVEEKLKTLTLCNDLNKERLGEALQLLSYWQSGDPEHHYEEHDPESMGCITRQFFAKLGINFNQIDGATVGSIEETIQEDLEEVSETVSEAAGAITYATEQLKKAKDLIRMAIPYVEENAEYAIIQDMMDFVK